MRVALVEHLAGVEQHRAPPNPGEFLLDLIRLHHRVLGHDLFQKQTERGDVPLAVPERVEPPSLGVLSIDLEGQIKRAARRDDAQVLVEDEQGLADGVHDGLRQCGRIVALVKADGYLIGQQHLPFK